MSRQYFRDPLPSRDDMGSRLYIGRLPLDIREREVEKEFRKFGRIRNISLKGNYCFLQYESSRDAKDAVHEMNDNKIFGDRLQVEHARTPKEFNGGGDRGGSRGGGGGYGGGGGGGGGYGGGGDRFSGPRRSPPRRSDYRLAVKNLSTRCSWQDLKAVMNKAGEVVFSDAHKRHVGEGVVEFSTRKDMERAQKKLDGLEINGKPIKLEEEAVRRSRRSRSRSSSRSSSRSRSRSRSRSGSGSGSSRSRSRSRSKSGSPSSKKKRSRRSRSRSRSKSRDSRSKSKSRSKSRSKSKSKSRSKSHSKSRSRSKSKERTSGDEREQKENGDSQEAKQNGDSTEQGDEEAAVKTEDEESKQETEPETRDEEGGSEAETLPVKDVVEDGQEEGVTLDSSSSEEAMTGIMDQQAREADGDDVANTVTDPVEETVLHDSIMSESTSLVHYEDEDSKPEEDKSGKEDKEEVKEEEMKSEEEAEPEKKTPRKKKAPTRRASRRSGRNKPSESEHSETAEED